nr:polyprotein [Mute swan feces associated picorna-like virus 2]
MSLIIPPVICAACSLYAIFREITSFPTVSVTPIVIHCIGIVSSLVSLANVLKFPIYNSLAKLTLRFIQLIDPNYVFDYDEPQAYNSNKTVLTSLKIFTVMSTFAASFFDIDVTKRYHSLNTSLQVARNSEEFLTDLLSSTFGIDLTGEDQVRTTVTEFETEGAKFIDASFYNFSHFMVEDARKWKRETENLIRTIKPSTICTSTLTAQLVKITTLISKVLTARTENRRRPVPAAVYLWGAEGRGKTSFFNHYLIPSLNQAFGIEETKGGTPYNLNAGKHFTTLTTERWAFYDEFGARQQERNDSVDPTCLNNIISGCTAALPGAAVDEKNQVSNFNGVFLASNRALLDVDVGFTMEAKRAFITRWMEVEVVDPRWSPTSGRANQNHRTSDYSHLQFYVTVTNSRYANLGVSPTALLPTPSTSTSTAGAKPKKTVTPSARTSRRLLTAPELVQAIIADIKFNQDNFATMQSAVAANTTPPAGFELYNDVPEVSAFQNVFWISGAPALGKTTTLIPLLKACITATPYEVVTTLDPQPDNQRLFYILDDVVDPATIAGQRAFMEFVNQVHPNSVVIVISNHFNPLRRWHLDYYRLNVQPFVGHEPGFERRCGVYTSRHFHYDGANLTCYYAPQTVSFRPSGFLPYVMRHLTGYSPIEVVFGDAPPDLKYDIFVDLGQNYKNPVSFIYAITRQCVKQTLANPRTMRLAKDVRKIIKLYESLSSAPPPKVLAKMFEFCRDQAGTFSIKIISNIGTMCYHDGVVYVQKFAKMFVRTDTTAGTISVILQHNDGEGIVSCHKYDRLRAMRRNLLDPATLTQDDSALLLLRESHHPIWNEVLAALPCSLSDSLARMKDSIRRSTMAWWKSLKINGYYILFFALFSILLYAAYKYFPQKKHSCVCTTKLWNDTERDQSICPFDHPEAKKAGAKRNSRFMHFKTIKYNTQLLSAEQAGDGHMSERVWGVVAANAKAGKKSFTASIGPYNHIRAEYDDDEMRWNVFDMDVPEASSLRDSNVFKKIASNVFKVTAACTSSMKCTMLNNSIGMIPRHFSEFPGPWTVVSPVDNKTYTLVPITEDRYRELLIVRVQRRGKDAQLPGVASLNNMLLTLDQVRTVELATMIIPVVGGIDTVTSQYEFQERPAKPFDHEDLRSWQQNVGIVAFGNYSTATSPGDCGSPVIGHYNDKYYLIGIHAAKRPTVRCFASVVICSELWTEIANLQPRDQPECATSNYTQYRSDAGLFLMPPELDSLKTKRRPGSYQPSGALQYIATLKNKKPMDTKNRKVHFDDFPKTLENFDRKLPALSESEIYLNHQDKIPPDANGNVFPFLIRTKRLESNYYNPDVMPGFRIIAKALGEHYTVQMGRPPLAPLSVKAAIAGSYICTPMDLNTSAGAIMTNLVKAHNKADIVNSEGHFFISQVEKWTNDQWELAGKGYRLSFPADACYKAETLAPAKVHRKRVFFNVPLPTIINLKRILAPVHHLFASNFDDSPYLFNADPIRDWDLLFQKLFEQSGKFVTLDSKAYDMSINSHVLLAAEDFFCALYQLPDHDTPLRLRIRTLMKEVAFMPLLFETVLVAKQGGLPSGIWGTDMLDDITLDIKLCHAWMHITRLPLHSYLTNVTKKVCGDDLIATVSPDYIDVFNGETIREHFEQHFNVLITPAMKDDKVVPYLTKDETMFCSRHFVPCPNHPSAKIPKLKSSSLSSPLEWVEDTNTFARYNQYSAVMLDIVPYGAECYNTYMDELTQFAAKHKIPHTPTTYSDAIDLTWQRLSTPRPRRYTKIYSLQAVNSQTNYVPLKDITYVHTPNMSSSIYKANNRKLFSAVRHAGKSGMSMSVFWEEYEKLMDLIHRTPFDAFEWDQTVKVQRPNANYKIDTYIPHTTTVAALICGMNDSTLKPALRCVDRILSSVCRQPIFKKPNMTTREHSWNLIIDAHRDLVNLIRLRDLTESDLPHSYKVVKPAKHFQGLHYWLFREDYIWWPLGDQPEADAAPTEGGNVVTGASGGSQLDPLIAPAMTVTPAQAIASQEVADSDDTTFPNVLTTVGGLTPLGLPAVNYADNVVSLCDKAILVRRYAINASTLAGSIIEEIDFNPWDSTLVSTPIAQYGSLHGVFSGSINFQLNSYSASTIIGSIIIAYIPPIMQNNFNPTLVNLKTLPSAVLNLKVGGTAQISVNAGNLTDSAVSREKINDGSSVYGKIIIAAYTDIVNAYGVSVSIPVIRLCSLGADAYFSHPWYLYGTTDTTDPTLEIAPTPPLAQNLVIDGANMFTAVDFPDLRSFRPLPYFNPVLEAGYYETCHTLTSGDQIKFSDSESKDVALALWWGTNLYGPNNQAVFDSAPPESEARRACPFTYGATTKATNYNATSSKNYGYLCPMPDTSSSSDLRYTGIIVNLKTTACGFAPASISDSDINATGNYRSRAILQPNTVNSFLASEIVCQPYTPDTSTFDSTYREAVLYSILGDCTVTNRIYDDYGDDALKERGGNTLDGWTLGYNDTTYDVPRISVQGTPTCTQAATWEDNCPTGFFRLRFDNNEQYFIPAVNDAIATTARTMPYTVSETAFQVSADGYFKRNRNVLSYSYDISNTVGASVGAVLVNPYGSFVYSDTTLTGFDLLPNASTISYSNMQTYDTLWPAITAIPEDQFTSRIVSPARTYVGSGLNKKLVYHNIDKISDPMRKMTVMYDDILRRIGDEPQAAVAMMGIGMGMQGVSSGLFKRKEMKLEKYKADLMAQTALRTTAMTGYTGYHTAKYTADQKYRLGMAQMGYDAGAATQGTNSESSAYETAPSSMSHYSTAPSAQSSYGTAPTSQSDYDTAPSVSDYYDAAQSLSDSFQSIPSRRTSSYGTAHSSSVRSAVNRQNSMRRNVQKIPASRVGPTTRTTAGARTPQSAPRPSPTSRSAPVSMPRSAPTPVAQAAVRTAPSTASYATASGSAVPSAASKTATTASSASKTATSAGSSASTLSRVARVAEAAPVVVV